MYPLMEAQHAYEDWDESAFSIWELLQFWIYSSNIVETVYRIEREILLNDIDTNVCESCGKGIHFFRDKQVATAYYFDDPREWISHSLMEFNNVVPSLYSGDPEPIRSKNLMKICLDFERGELRKDVENSRIY